MGVVYEAYDRERSEVVALKTLPPREASSGLFLLKHEFRALADVAHPNLINLYEFLVEDGHWFFTMELIEGVHFLDYVSIGAAATPALDGPLISSAITLPAQSQRPRQCGEPPLPPDRHIDALGPEIAHRSPRFREAELRSALVQLAEGLVALHDKAILHRDIKSSNVLVTSSGRVVILDFGISTDRATRAPEEGRVAVGTPSYMSPEQVLSESIGEASDWYSVGVMVYRALTWRFPFEGSIEDIIRNKLRTEPAPVSDIAEDIPEDLSSLCRDLLRRRAEARPTGREVLARLNRSSPSPSSLPLAVVSDTPFLGREPLLDELHRALAAVRAGTTVSVYIHGASGMGKTALVRHFLDGIDPNHGALVLTGRCYERESVPYKAVDGIIDCLSRYLMTLPDGRCRELVPGDVASLSRLFPVLQQIDSVALAPLLEQEARDPLALRRRGFAALRVMLARIGEQRPLVLFIDDLQWSDADSMILLEDLLRPPDPPRLLLLGSFRGEEIESKPFLQDLLKHVGSAGRRELRVAPLSVDEVDAWLVQCLAALTTLWLTPLSPRQKAVHFLSSNSPCQRFTRPRRRRTASASAKCSTGGCVISRKVRSRCWRRWPWRAAPLTRVWRTRPADSRGTIDLSWLRCVRPGFFAAVARQDAWSCTTTESAKRSWR